MVFDPNLILNHHTIYLTLQPFKKQKRSFNFQLKISFFFLTHGISGTQPYITLPEADASVSASNSAASRGLRRQRLEDTMDTAGVSGAESAPSIMR